MRRLRLIHAGRILSDGTQLVSWLDALDSHKRAQAARAEAAGAAGPRAWVARLERELAEDVSGDEEDEAESESSSLLTGKNERQSVGKRKGKEKAGDGEIAQEEVEDREEERVYIQCSVGDVMDEAEQLAERHEAVSSSFSFSNPR